MPVASHQISASAVFSEQARCKAIERPQRHTSLGLQLPRILLGLVVDLEQVFQAELLLPVAAGSCTDVSNRCSVAAINIIAVTDSHAVRPKHHAGQCRGWCSPLKSLLHFPVWPDPGEPDGTGGDASAGHLDRL